MFFFLQLFTLIEELCTLVQKGHNSLQILLAKSGTKPTIKGYEDEVITLPTQHPVRMALLFSFFLKKITIIGYEKSCELMSTN